MTPFTLAALVALALAALALFNGIRSMAHGGPDDERESYGHMISRVRWHAVAAVAVFLGLLAQLD